MPLQTETIKRRTIEFQESTFAWESDVHVAKQWNWTEIQALLDELSPLIHNRKSTVSESQLACSLYGYLPQDRGELRLLTRKIKTFWNMCSRGSTAETKKLLLPYKKDLRLLLNAVRFRWIREVLSQNHSAWGKKAYALFFELQQNLGKNMRTFTLSVTFLDAVDEATGEKSPPTYDRVREWLRNFTKNTLRRAGFASVEVIGFQPEPGNPGRLHVHIMLWGVRERTPQAENESFRRLLGTMKKTKEWGLGTYKVGRPRTTGDFLRCAAYLAYNYDVASKLDRGNDWNPIPPNKKLKSTPKEVQPGVSWTHIGGFSFYNPRTVAWRRAIAEYASQHGFRPDGNWQWIWRQRRAIARYLRREEWLPLTVTGQDGFTYEILPLGDIGDGVEWYELRSSECVGRGFHRTSGQVKFLASLEALPNVLPKNTWTDVIFGTNNKFV